MLYERALSHTKKRQRNKKIAKAENNLNDQFFSLLVRYEHVSGVTYAADPPVKVRRNRELEIFYRDVCTKPSMHFNYITIIEPNLRNTTLCTPIPT